MPHVIKVLISNWVLNAGGVAAGDEVGNAAANTGRCVPQNFGGTTIIHGGGPYGEDSVIGVEGSIRKESSVLCHAFSEGNIIIFAPATEWVKKQDGISIALSDELFASVLKEEHVTIVERVSHLEGVHNIGVFLNNLGLNLRREKSILIVAVVEDWSLNPAHGGPGDKEVTLSEDSLGAWVVLRHAAESTGADLFFAIIEEDGVLNYCEDSVGADGGALDGNLLFTIKGSLLLGSHVLGDGNREEVALALMISDCLHVHGLEELKLVHESL